MASRKFSGRVGYVSAATEITPGVWKTPVIEVLYYGDILRNTRRLEENAKVNDDVVINNNISIVADPYAVENFLSMRYVQWLGTLWTITNVEVQGPRLLLTLGGVYNGPKA
jgi:hypothetical protein